jgi:putative RNA 2'-phosphotransferase
MRNPITARSRAVSHALRHEPWLYGLELDDGFTDVASLAAALGCTASDVLELSAHSAKDRFEVNCGLIRVRYSHSLVRKVAHDGAEPPARPVSRH